MYKRVLAVMAVTLLVTLYFNIYMKDADQGDPWRGVDLNKKLTIEELGWLEEREWMAIGFSDELIPFIMEEDGRLTGLLTSYMERILEPLGIGIRYVQVEKEQVDSMLSDGTLDGYLVIPSSNLTEGHAYSAPLIPVKGKLFLRNLPDSPGREELIGKRILRFSSEGLSLEGVSLDQYNEIQEAGSMEEARELLEKGSYDGIAGSEDEKQEGLVYPALLFSQGEVPLEADDKLFEAEGGSDEEDYDEDDLDMFEGDDSFEDFGFEENWN